MRFLFVDRIIQLIPGSVIKGIKHLTKNDGYIDKNEQGRFYFAPSLIGEALGQLAAWNVMFTNDFTQRPVAGIVGCARVYRQAYVGEILLLESIIDSLDEEAVQYHSIARIGDNVIFTVDGAVGPLLPMARFISQKEVRRQFDDIYQPGGGLDPLEPSLVDNHAVINENSLKPFAFTFDEITHCEPGVSMTAMKKICPSAPYFPDHFPHNPVLPMTVLLECKLTLAHLFLQESGMKGHYQVSELRKIKMNDFVSPEDLLFCYVSVLQQNKQQLILRFRSEIENKRVCVLDVVMVAKGN